VMRYEELPVFELSVVFAAERERASSIVDRVAELVCNETGGTGDGDDHVCGGFHCASVRELPGGLLEDALE
jgi:hypothetical protein